MTLRWKNVRLSKWQVKKAKVMGGKAFSVHAEGTQGH